MCLVILGHRAHPRFPLIVAANRDEFYRRPTAPAQFWPQQPQLLAGRDLQAGGTWMGVTRSGRFAAVTNFRDPDGAAPAPRSRGELTVDFLSGTALPGDYLHEIAARARDYAGFNLLLGDGQSLWYFSNSCPRQRAPRALAPGIYGLSNALLDTPWPKIIEGKQRLNIALDYNRLDHDSLAQVVADRRLAEEQDLHPLGLHQDMERQLSAQFICATDLGYGTRATTTLLLDASGHASWRETSFDERGEISGRREEQFPLTP